MHCVASDRNVFRAQLVIQIARKHNLCRFRLRIGTRLAVKVSGKRQQLVCAFHLQAFQKEIVKPTFPEDHSAETNRNDVLMKTR